MNQTKQKQILPTYHLPVNQTPKTKVTVENGRVEFSHSGDTLSDEDWLLLHRALDIHETQLKLNHTQAMKKPNINLSDQIQKWDVAEVIVACLVGTLCLSMLMFLFASLFSPRPQYRSETTVITREV